MHCNKKGLVALIAGSLLLAFTGRADPWFAYTWETRDGLPDSDVRAVAQTPDGYLWVATQVGMARFDGARFTEFPLSRLDTNCFDRAERLLLDSRKRLWIALQQGGAVCVDDKTVRVFPAVAGRNIYPTDMVEDGEGAIWIGLGENHPVVRIKDGSVATFGRSKGFPGNGSVGLAVDEQGRMWFSRGRQVGVFRNQRFEVVFNANRRVARIAGAKGGGIWMAAGPELYRLAGDGRPEKVGEIPGRPGPTVLKEDSTGRLWLGTSAHGLFCYAEGTLEPVGVSHKDITSLIEDREGNIWVGTAGGGLNRLRRRAVELVGAATGQPFESLRSLCRDGSGTVWVVGRNSQVWRQEKEEWINVSADTNGPQLNAGSVVAHPEGGVWIAARGSGLFRYRDGKFQRWRTREGLASDTLRSLLVSADRALWVTSDRPIAVQRFDGRTWQNFKLPEAPGYLRAMAEDCFGNIWIGTTEGHLLRVTDGTVVHETIATLNPPASIRCLTALPDGSIWIGYAARGVGRLKGGRFSVISSAQGLRDDYVSQIMPDDRGWFWFGGGKGIFKVQQKELEDVAEGRLARVRSILYERGEGVPDLQTAYEVTPGWMRDADGSVWMATRKGLAIIRTEQINDNPQVPPVWIEQVNLDGQPVPVHQTFASRGKVSGRLKLPPRHRRLDFEFSAPSFSAPENVQFKYRLDGLDENWIDAGTARSATYPQLPAGNYRFRVVACNNSGVWNEAGALMSFVVTPFFWQTWWFRLALTAVFTLTIVAVVRYVSFRRLRLHLQELEQQAVLDKERARIAKDLHDDLGANLTQITLLLELAKQNGVASNGNGHVQESIATAQEAIKTLDATVWAFNPRNNTLPEVIDYLGQFTVEFLQNAGITCHPELPDDPPAWPMSAEARHHLCLIVKEALNNVVRHARATKVWLRIAVENDQLTLMIEDNGQGFEQLPADNTADGLRNMRQRAEEMGGSCEINSRPGAGTTIRVVYSRRKKASSAAGSNDH